MRKTWNVEDEQYFGIGIYMPKNRPNIGTLWRTAYVFGAKFIFVIEKKYKKQTSDVFKVWSKIPLFQYESFDALCSNLPYSCKLIGVEMDESATELKKFTHPARAIYLLGAEDNGLPIKIKKQCHELIQIPGELSLNVSVAGSIVIYDRITRTYKDL